MSTENNNALVRRFYQEIDKGNLEAMDELVADDYIDPFFLEGQWLYEYRV